MITRRELLKRSAFLAAVANAGPLHELFAQTKNKIKIGACDLSVVTIATFLIGKDITIFSTNR